MTLERPACLPDWELVAEDRNGIRQGCRVLIARLFDLGRRTPNGVESALDDQLRLDDDSLPRKLVGELYRKFNGT